MAKALTYAEKLRHPRWQKRRLEALSLADFKCEDCGDGDTTLNVHHIYYQSGWNPWDYPPNLLRVLCENCHKEAHDVYMAFQYIYAYLPQDERDRLVTQLGAYINNHQIPSFAKK